MTSTDPTVPEVRGGRTAAAAPRGCTNLRLHRLVRRLDQIYDAEMARAGLKTTQYSLLSHVVRLAPVRPGDTLHTETEVIEVNPSRSKPDRGILRMRYQAINQHGDAVLSFIVNHYLKRQPA